MSRRFFALLLTLLSIAPLASGQRLQKQASEGNTPDELPTVTKVLGEGTRFGVARLGERSVRRISFTNTSSKRTRLDGLIFEGPDADAFDVVTTNNAAGGNALGLRAILKPGRRQTVTIAFTPQRRGMHTATVRVAAANGTVWKPARFDLSGVGIGPVGDELRINCGDLPFVDETGEEWARDYGAWRGAIGGSGAPIAGTEDDDLYRSQRIGPRVRYALGVPRRGNYQVTLHFAELVHTAPGKRVFDVVAEGDVVVSSLDLAAVAGGAVAHTETFTARVRDGWLDLDLDASRGFATLSAIAVRAVPVLRVRPARADFGALETGQSASRTLAIRNLGAAALTIESVEFRLGASGHSAAFSFALAGATYTGANGGIVYSTSVELEPGEALDATLTFAPTREAYDTPSLVLGFRGADNVARDTEIPLIGLGGHEGDPYLHAVNTHTSLAIDYDGDGSEAITFDASGSHTHEPGRSIVDWSFEIDGGPISSGSPVVVRNVASGSHSIEVTIADDGAPVRTLPLTTSFDVVATDEIPGVLALYYPAAPGGASALLDLTPVGATFAEVLDAARVEGPATIGGSSLTTNVMVRLTSRIAVPPSGGSYLFAASGGVARRLELDGTPVTGARVLAAGFHTLEARFAVDVLADLPLEVTLALDGAPAVTITSSEANHDEGTLVPVINDMPATGTTLGGNEIVIEGMGFFPDASVIVHWGGTALTSSSFTSISASEISFVSPPSAAGTISVSVETPIGTSNAKDFLYDVGGPVAIDFRHDHDYTVPQPTAAAWGPDGKLYVIALDGRLSVAGFSDDWALDSLAIHPGISGLTNNDSLGIAFDPFDEYDPMDPTAFPVRVYVAHGQHFANGGSSFTGFSPYSGQISVLGGPNFDAPVPVVTGLPTSNHDHSVNGIVFDNNGDLLICVGGNTNAGVPHPNMGDLPPSPLAGALLIAHTSSPTFNGTIQYVETVSGAASDDQVDGGIVDVAPGVDVEVYASGLRNPFGITLSTRGVAYTTDNGPNIGFGAASTGATTETADPYDGDEVLRIEYGAYYGFANRNRGRYDDRQNVNYASSSGVDIPEVFTQAFATVPSSTDGIDEYRADTFQGQMRGDLVTQKWYSSIRRVELSDDGRDAVSVTTLNAWAPALGLITAPGGAMIAIDYSRSRLRILEPDDVGAQSLEVYDIFPWRAVASGGARFEIGGVGFGSLADTTVSIGGMPAQITRVSSTRVEGIVPARVNPNADMLDIVVTVGTSSDTYAAGFRYLAGPGLELGQWADLPDVPVALGEVSTSIIDGILYLLGEGTNATLRYDVLARQWLANGPTRPYPGHHHSSEVVNGKLYLIGGLGGASEGVVQIFDPTANTWSLGSSMPWAGGSVSTVVIDDKIYAAGGIVGSWTANDTAVFDPASDAWTNLQQMPSGRNHAAAATDGQRMFIFGGRRGGNFVANGFDDVMIFDPIPGTWTSTLEEAATIAPLPVARGGTGDAVWYREEFYVFGGETLDDPNTVPGSNVYDRVDVYDPQTNTWRLEAPMTHPRHGLDPVVFQGRVLLPGGGLQAGFGNSNSFDEFIRR